MNSDARRSFRITTAEADRTTVEHLLWAEGFAFEPEPFFAPARALTHEPRPLGSSMAARLGLIHIQDRSSMLPPLALLSDGPEPGGLVFDLCAAPGGKTGILAELAGPQGLVVGCEPSPDRLGVLRATLVRTGAVNTATLRAASERLDWPDTSPSPARILLDPPCSGWGTTDKHPRARELWRGERVKPMIRLQRKLLARAAGLLAPGGRLVYSTCTFNPDENEAQVRWALDELGLVLRPLERPRGFVFDHSDLDGVLKVSEASEGQGFFVACLDKPGTEAPRTESGPDDSGLPGARLDPDDLDLPPGADFSRLPPGRVRDFGGRVFFLHELTLGNMPANAAWQGHLLGRLSGREFRPAALARVLLGSGGVDLDADELKELLSGASLDKGAAGHGLVGISFRGLGLGWAGSRAGRLMMRGS